MADLDTSFLGTMFDKFFGLVFGLIFCYSIFSTILISGSIFENNYLENKLLPLIKNNSSLMLKIDKTNIIIKPKLNETKEEIN